MSKALDGRGAACGWHSGIGLKNLRINNIRAEIATIRRLSARSRKNSNKEWTSQKASEAGGPRGLLWYLVPYGFVFEVLEDHEVRQKKYLTR